MRPTFHLVPAAVWAAAASTDPYVAASLADEGFIHCTDGATQAVHTANRHYRADPRPFVALTIDLDAIAAPWTVEDPAGIYPHVHGPIEREAIIATAPLERDADGRFVAVGQGTSSG
jgi:uncharacterized protein (DUF952 family)